MEEASKKLKDGVNKTQEPIVLENAGGEQSKKIAKLKSSHPALRPLARTMKNNGYEIEYFFSRFNSTSNLNEDGSETALPAGVFFNKTDQQLIFRYGYSSEVEFRFGGKYRMISANNSTNDVANNGLESIMVGIRYGLVQGNWLYAIDLEAGKTAYDTSDYTTGRAPLNEIVLGDDGTFSKIGLQMSLQRTDIHILNFSGHFQNLGRNLSQELPYHFDSTWVWSAAAISLGVDGIYSFKLDKDADDLSHRPVRATSPTKLFNSVNREIITPYVGLKFVWGKWALGGAFGQVIKGISTDRGSEFRVSVTWNNYGETEEQVKENKFKEYNIDAQIVKVSARGTFIKVDHGLAQDVEKGMRFDIFKTDYFGENVLIASGFVYELGSDWAIIKISRMYRDIPIKKGFAARAE